MLEVNIVIALITAQQVCRILEYYSYIIIIITIFIINKVCRQRFLGPSGFEIRIKFFGECTCMYKCYDTFRVICRVGYFQLTSMAIISNFATKLVYRLFLLLHSKYCGLNGYF